MNQDKLPFLPADILLPRDCAYSKWSVVACDQYTSQPEYWQRVEERVGLRPLHPAPHPAGEPAGGSRHPDRHHGDQQHDEPLSPGGPVPGPPRRGLYIERTLDGGKVRRGLVGRIDLEQYDYEPGSAAPIRATEAPSCPGFPPG